jgi:hypothetical protein
MGLCNLRGALSKSKLHPKLFVEYMEIKLEGFFKFDGFYVLVLWVMWIWRHPNGMEVHLWKFMKSQDLVSSKILFYFLSYMKCSIFTVFFFALKVSRFYVWKCIKYHLWIFNGEVDEVLLMQLYGQNFMHGELNFIKYSSMKSVLLEGTFFGYGHCRHSGGCYGLQQWAKCPFTYSL